MKNKIWIFLIAGVIPQICMAQDPRIQDLISEKQAKLEYLEKCRGTTKGLKIAGMSTLGLTAIGVVANISEASKIKDNKLYIQGLDEKINAAKNADSSGFAVDDGDYETDGQWTVKLSNGMKLKGSTFCSVEASKNRIKGEAETPNNKPGDYCWCRVDGYAENSETDFIGAPSPSWVFNLKIFPEADMPNYNCHSKCVEYCENAFEKDEFFVCAATYASGINIDSRKNIVKTIFSDRLGRVVRANALSALGFCNYYDGMRWHYSTTQDDCVGLNKEYWNVTFPGGLTLGGTSTCSSSSGENGDVYEDSEPEKTRGANCWCRAEESDITESVVWILGEKYDTEDTCEEECAEDCVSKVSSNKNFRFKLFGFI